MSDLEDKSPANLLRAMLREISLNCLRDYAVGEDWKLESFKTDLAIYGDRMALVLISGKPVKLTFKAHFMESEAKNLATKVYHKPVTSISTEQALDFMKEFCNITAGSLKKMLHEQGLITGISLPLVVRGFDEIYFSPSDELMSFEDHWRLSASAVKVICSINIEIYQPEVISTLQPLGSSGDLAGEVEFL